MRYFIRTALAAGLLAGTTLGAFAQSSTTIGTAAPAPAADLKQHRRNGRKLGWWRLRSEHQRLPVRLCIDTGTGESSAGGGTSSSSVGTGGSAAGSGSAGSASTLGTGGSSAGGGSSSSSVGTGGSAAGSGGGTSDETTGSVQGDENSARDAAQDDESNKRLSPGLAKQDALKGQQTVLLTSTRLASERPPKPAFFKRRSSDDLQFIFNPGCHGTVRGCYGRPDHAAAKEIKLDDGSTMHVIEHEQSEGGSVFVVRSQPVLAAYPRPRRWAAAQQRAVVCQQQFRILGDERILRRRELCDRERDPPRWHHH